MFSLGAAVSVAIAKAVESLFGIEPSIQWPNDVYLTGRKFGGILVETGREEGWGRYALVGMGINLNHERRDFPPHLRRMATSLREESGREMKVPVFLEGLITFLRKELASVYEKGFDGIRADYVRRSSLLHRRVRIKLAAEEIEAVVVDFGRCGEVVVRADGTGDRTLNYGEVVRVWR
jgi:BirA family biotin operon repressor/biotin-[acetyl-CoA-carboxylase] ligase